MAKKKKSKKRSRRGSHVAAKAAPAPAPHGGNEEAVTLQPFGQGPRFSILMAAYNRADLIHVAIDSVLAQDFSDYELVIVDDGSTDDTPVIVRGYSDPRIRYIRKELNEGRSPTRNRAVAEARGEFVLWMADDDLLMPGVLSLYDSIFKQYPKVDIAYGDLQLFDHDSGQDLNVFTPNDWTGRARDVIGAKLYGSCVPDGGTATRRTIYTKVGPGPYDDEFVRAQDYELWTRIVGHVQFHKVDEVVYRYRKHAGGTSWGEFIDLTLDSKIIRRHLTRHPLRTLFPKLDWTNERMATGLAYLRIAKNLVMYGDLVNAQRFLNAIPGGDSQPGAVEQRVRIMVGLGDYDGAMQSADTVESHFGPAAGPLHRELRALVENATRLSRESAAYFQAREYGEVIRLSRAYADSDGSTFESIIWRARAHLELGQVEEALHCFCLAGRLNPDDTESSDAVEQLVARLGPSPKTDLSAMRRRLKERFVSLPSHVDERETDGPLVSIIVTGTSASIEASLTCAMAQTYQATEVLIAEKPDPNLWSDALSDGRIRVLSAVDGVSFEAQALQQSRGDFVAWISEDTWWYPSHLARAMAAFGNGHDVVFCHSHLLYQAAEGLAPVASDERANYLLMPEPAFTLAGNLARPFVSLSLAVHRRGAAEWQDGEFPRWQYLLQLLDNEAVCRLPVMGAVQTVKDQAGLDDPAADRDSTDIALRFLSVYRRFEHATLFDPLTRKKQNERIASIGLRMIEQGRTPILVLGASNTDQIDGCLTSISANTLVPSFVIFILRESQTNLISHLKAKLGEQATTRLVIAPDTLSDAKLINEGLVKASGRYVAVTHVDTRLTQGWLGRLQWCLSEHPDDVAAIQPSVVESVGRPARFHSKPLSGTVTQAMVIDQRCVVIERRAFQRVGGMDLSLGAPGLEWHDFSLRLRLGGLRILLTADFSVESSLADTYVDAESVSYFKRRWGCEPTALMGVQEEFNPELHHSSIGAEEGYRPDGRAVEVVEASGRVLLVMPPWDEAGLLGEFLGTLRGHQAGVSVLLRAPAHAAEQALSTLKNVLEGLNLEASELPDLLVVDSPLAPEREGGLYLASDAVFIGDGWPDSRQTVRRAADTGRHIIRETNQLTQWLEKS